MATQSDQPMFAEVSSKRRFSADNGGDEDEEMIDDMKKRRMPAGEDIGPKLVNMIKKLDEDLNGASMESALESLAITLEENLNPYEGQIIHILYECAAYLPEKITIFSTLVGVLNSRSQEFGERLIAKFMDELHNTFVTEEYDIAIRIVTFLCDLGNSRVVTLNSILDFLEDLVEMADVENNKSDFFVYTVLHTLPWIGPELNEKLQSRLNNLLNRIGNYLAKRAKEHVKILQVWSDPSFPQGDYLDSLWAQLQKLKEANWVEKHILRTYAHDHFTSILNESVQHELPSLNRGVLQESSNYPLPRVVFRLFQPTDCPDGELPADDAIERFLVEEDLNWIIDNNYTDWKLCARALLNYYRKETVPLNYVIIETIFGQLFRLPNAAHLEIFYGALLIELCRTQASSLPQVLALAAEMLFQRADTMQPICLDRFVDWFSYHLSNFEYRWSWRDWADCVELDSLHPKRIFVREVIDKCMRLSYHKKLKEFLPEEFAPIIPDEPQINYVLDDDQLPAYEKAEQLNQLVMQKRGDADILAALEVPSASGEEEPEEEGAVPKEKEYSPDSVAVFFAVLLKLASKTLTHSFAALTRYHKTLCTLTRDNEAMQSIILRTLYDSWSLHKQMMTVLVDKMIKMKILEPAIVQAWVFSDEMKVEFKRSWVWDVLSSAVTHLERQQKKFIRDREALISKLQHLKKQNQMESTRIKLERAPIEDMEEAPTDENGQQRPRITAPREEGEQQMDLDEAAQQGQAGMDADSRLSLEDRIANLNEQIEYLKADLKYVDESLRNVLLNICLKFSLILTEHIINCESDGTEVETNFYNFVAGRFKYVFLKHAENVWKFEEDLERELFSQATIGPRIRQIFNQFKSLHH